MGLGLGPAPFGSAGFKAPVPGEGARGPQPLDVLEMPIALNPLLSGVQSVNIAKVIICISPLPFPEGWLTLVGIGWALLRSQAYHSFSE